jgi:primosomal protein N' (replication factor Y)
MVNCEVSAPIILQVAIAVPLDRLFDYCAPDGCTLDDIKLGMRVLVPFGNRRKIGFVVGVSSNSGFDVARLKQVEKILDAEPLLSAQDLALLQWASHYYHHPLGEVLSAAFPGALRQGKAATSRGESSFNLTPKGRDTGLEQLKRAPKQQALLALFHSQGTAIREAELKSSQTALKILLEKGLVSRCTEHSSPQTLQLNAALSANAEQQAAIDAIIAGLGSFSVYLLEGVTGSGKTEVYMQVIAAVLSQGLQVLVLLPEITLTPQLEQRFLHRFGVPIVSFHSRLTDTQRLNAWLGMQQNGAAIMLGTRSALFTPLKVPGLIILDEEHDASFKQQEGFRFSARDVAIARAKSLNVPVVLGSATPSLESLFNVERQRYRLLHLSVRAGNAVAPVFQLLDIRNKKMQAGLSESLITAIKATLVQNQQVLLFLNRRGYAPVQICHGCGWVSRCRHCDANLVIHAAEKQLRCHHCGSAQELLSLCPACKSGELQAVGMGTERIEQTLISLFPDKLVLRLDRDTTQRKGSLETYLQQINSGEADIIIGTQMLAKGHHFPNVTLVAILDIDSGLFSIDFRAGEKLAQLIVQVAGRAGRADKPGRVILQTRQPQHPLLITLLEQGYRAFAQTVLQERQQASLPPYSHQALFRVYAATHQAPQPFLAALSHIIATANTGDTLVMGPVSAPMARRAGQYHFQLLLQNTRRQELHRLLDIILPAIAGLKEARAVRWSLDVDPVDLF